MAVVALAVPWRCCCRWSRALCRPAGGARPPGRRAASGVATARLGTPAAHPFRVGPGQPGPQPGRTLLGAGALAIGVAALTLVAAAGYAFRGAIVGSLLGDMVSLSVRGADTMAAAATVLLGAAAVADCST